MDKILEDFIQAKNYIALVGIIFLFSSCENAKEKENIIVGQWEAEWQTSRESFPMVNNPSHLKMNGKFHFKKNGTVEVHAFGYNGCIFMSDTMKNQLVWKVNGDTLNMSGQDDSFGLPYQLKEINPDHMQLVLMEDISLNLRKN